MPIPRAVTPALPASDFASAATTSATASGSRALSRLASVLSTFARRSVVTPVTSSAVSFMPTKRCEPGTTSSNCEGRPTLPSTCSPTSTNKPESSSGVLRRVSEPADRSSRRATSLRDIGPWISTSSATARVAPLPDVHRGVVIRIEAEIPLETTD